MDIVWFTITAAILYFAADRALDALERRAGKRFPQRSLIFFALILVLALLVFPLMSRLLGPG